LQERLYTPWSKIMAFQMPRKKQLLAMERSLGTSSGESFTRMFSAINDGPISVLCRAAATEPCDIAKMATTQIVLNFSKPACRLLVPLYGPDSASEHGWRGPR